MLGRRSKSKAGKGGSSGDSSSPVPTTGTAAVTPHSTTQPSPAPPLPPSTVFRSSLNSGFQTLASKRSSSYPKSPQRPGVAPPTSFDADHHQSIIVGGGEALPPPHQSSPPCWSSAQSSCFVQFIEPEKNEFYPLIDTILHNELKSMIRNVPYQNARSGANGVIDCLFLRTISTTSAAFYAQKSLLEGVPVPADELHLQPYCHVYIAGCDGMDQYRNKVRPALQEFVTEMEEDGDGQYMILYVPSSSAKGFNKLLSGMSGVGGGRSTSMTTSGASKLMRSNSNVDDGSSGAGGGGSSSTRSLSVGDNTTASSSPMSAAAVAASASASISTEVSVKDREMLKKFNIDFPGRTVMLSTLLDAQQQSSSSPRKQKGQQNQPPQQQRTIGGINAFTFTSRSSLFQSEWDKFLKHLGTIMIGGFQRRCKEYDDELRKMDKKRSTPSEFDFKKFVLIKESLAFTYEQMRLFREALLHYEELSAFVPEDPPPPHGSTVGAVASSSDVTDPSSPPAGGGATAEIAVPTSHSSLNSMDEMLYAEATNYAAAGDTDGFRKVIRATKVDISAQQFHQYFFARQCHFLFLLHRPVEVIKKTHDFIIHSYRLKLADPMFTPAETESWALSACWDLKTASEVYFSFDVDTSLSSSFYSSVGMSSLRDSFGSTSASQYKSSMSLSSSEAAAAAVGAVEDEKEASRQLSETLEFGRQRLLRLGDMELQETKDDDNDDDERGGDGVGDEKMKKTKVVVNPIRRATTGRPAFLFGNWVPWKDLPPPPPSSPSNTASSPPRWTPVRGPSTRYSSTSASSSSLTRTPTKPNLGSAFIGDALSSPEAFESRYMEISNAIVRLYQHSGRKRLASRMLGEQADLYIIHGDYESAARILLDTADEEHGGGVGGSGAGCFKDGWYDLHFWRLFRLACCQRLIGDGPSYLRTLVKCFSPNFGGGGGGGRSSQATAAPPLISHLFQDDLECLVKEENVAGSMAQLGVSPFLDTEIFVEQCVIPSSVGGGGGGCSSASISGSVVSSGSSVLGRRAIPLGFLRKKLINTRCHVGEKMTISISIVSHLPKAIQVDGVRLFVVTYEKYERIYRSGGSSEVSGGSSVASIVGTTGSVGAITFDEKCSFRVLAESGPITLQPGKNVRKFHWIPMTVGQYVLASVEILWGEASFAHDSASLRRPVQGIEVLPSDSTQRVELHPLFLLPGEKQEIRLSIQSKDDIITEGLVELNCSDGLRVLHPEMTEDQPDAWCDKCVVRLNPCGPDTSQTVKTLVKSDALTTRTRSSKSTKAVVSSTGIGGVQTLRAVVVTSYHHRLYKDLTEDDEPEGPPMETTLEALVTTLDRPALTFHTSKAFSLSKTSVMVSVSVLCNTPTPFYIKEWDVYFPPPLELADGGDDANDVLIGHPVALGQEIFFGFACNRLQDHSSSSGKEDSAWSTTTTPMKDDDVPDKPTLTVVLRDDQGKTFQQILTLDLESFYDQMRAEDEYSGVNTATAVLQCRGSDEGIVGAPVQFTYVVDTNMITEAKRKTSPRANPFSSSSTAMESFSSSSSMQPPPLLYSIACDEKYWVLGGKVRGTVPKKKKKNKKNIGGGGEEDNTATASTTKEKESFSVDFVGIPTHSGMLKHYPEITMYYAPSKFYTSPAITVHCHVPGAFMSLSFKNHMALAAPAILDAATSTATSASVTSAAMHH